MVKPYYEQDGITIYHGDCREILPELPTGAIVTDPPYGVGKDYGEFDDTDGPAYWEWFLDVLRLMRKSSPMVVFTHRLAALRHITDWDWIYVWNKPLAMSGLNWFPVMPHWEPIFTFGIAGRGLNDLPRGYDVLSFNPQPSHGSGHPAPKPVALFAELIRRFAPVEIVIDPFMGTGTTLRAAKDAGRQAIGIEIEERYCEIAAQRLGQMVLAFDE